MAKPRPTATGTPSTVHSARAHRTRSDAGSTAEGGARRNCQLVLRYTSENVFVPLTVGGGIRGFTDANGRHYTSLEVASEYFRSGADKISIGSDAVYSAEEYLRIGVKTGKSSLEQISRVYGNQVQMEKSMPGISALLMVGEKVDQLELMSLQKQMKSWELEKYY